ncbi:hypothetical protein AX14_007295 [Amanita brunnescens Koide BX004]|nr:hypothetical protein AX14_007295 [Amanita brunnescens Koide BX004]
MSGTMSIPTKLALLREGIRFRRPEPDASHGREGIYFARADDHRWKELSKAVAQALYDVGKGHSPEPRRSLLKSLNSLA